MKRFTDLLPFLILGLFLVLIHTEAKAQNILSFFPQTEKCNALKPQNARNSAVENAEEGKFAWFGINLFASKFQNQQLRAPKQGAAVRVEQPAKIDNRSTQKESLPAVQYHHFGIEHKPIPNKKHSEIINKRQIKPKVVEIPYNY